MVKGLKRKERKNKMMLEVLNVEMPWQGAIRWKGMHVKKKRTERKRIDKQKSAKKSEERAGGGGDSISKHKVLRHFIHR